MCTSKARKLPLKRKMNFILGRDIARAKLLIFPLEEAQLMKEKHPMKEKWKRMQLSISS
jgi:hypothetical protein